MADCPVCRRPISHWRMFRTTAFGSFYCAGCDSKLGVDMKRRFLALVPWTAIVFFLLIVVQIMNYGVIFTVALLAPILFFIFAAIDRAIVIERAGLRCPECGYDLQGQVVSICSECGYRLNEEDAALLARVREGMVDGGTLRRSQTGRGRKILIAVGVVVIVAMSVAMVGGMLIWRSNASSRSQAPETLLLTLSVLARVTPPGANPPGHALRMALDDALTTHQFVRSDTTTRRDQVQLAGVSLSTIDSMADADLERLLDDLDASLPEGVIAHRVGDFVFTYHGVSWPAKGEAKGLWIVVGVPEPRQNPAAAMSTPIGRADGSVIILPAGGLIAALAIQNNLRRKLGLSPLPDPATVTHEGPAVGESLIDEE